MIERFPDLIVAAPGADIQDLQLGNAVVDDKADFIIELQAARRNLVSQISLPVVSTSPCNLMNTGRA